MLLLVGLARPLLAQTGTVGVQSPHTVTTDGVATADTAGLSLRNTTAATAQTTQQNSPQIVFTGSGWISSASKSCDVTEGYYPSTANGIDNRPGGYLKWFHKCPGDSAPQEMMRLSSNGNLLAASGIDAGFGKELGLAGFVQGDYSLSYNGAIYWRGQSTPTNPTRVMMNSPARGMFRWYESDQLAAGVEVNIGTARPTLSACGTGAMGATATNVVGGFTTTGAGATCTLNFGSPAWTNTPSCILMDASRSATLRPTAVSATSYTITGFTAGDSVFYICLGGF